MHPPQSPIPQGPPGALPLGSAGPIDSVPVDRMNEMYMQERQGTISRLEADSRGYDSVFSQ